MPRTVQLVVRSALLTIVAAPCVAYADALPPDPDDIYYHCTAAEQCPSGSATCPSIHGAAGHTHPDEACAARATASGLEQRCAGSAGYLYCAHGATGSWTAPGAVKPRRGCF